MPQARHWFHICGGRARGREVQTLHVTEEQLARLIESPRAEVLPKQARLQPAFPVLIQLMCIKCAEYCIYLNCKNTLVYTL